MRLDKLLAHMGYGTRKEVKQLLKSGAVMWNGEVIKSANQKVNPEEDSITVYGERVEYKEFLYLMTNKPADVISATWDKMDQTVIDLLIEEDRHFEPFPVGRLDKDTEGLLLLTNDGKLAHQLLTPKNNIAKTYMAKVKHPIDEEDVKRFAEGIQLEEFMTKPAVLERTVDDLIIRVTITEGKFHQVKRMVHAIDNEVLHLQRVSMGSLKLDESLALGEYRELTDEELSSLLKDIEEAGV
ncbi:MAG TPA: pseudouridine synthase [Savagea sp.]